MTDFQKKWKDHRKEWEKKEEERVGDIYAECVKRGCNQRFLESFDTRIWMYPVKQTKAFLSVPKDGKYSSDIESHLKQWEIYLQVLLEKRSNHEKADEWATSLELLK